LAISLSVVISAPKTHRLAGYLWQLSPAGRSHTVMRAKSMFLYWHKSKRGCKLDIQTTSVVCQNTFFCMWMLFYMNIMTQLKHKALF